MAAPALALHDLTLGYDRRPAVHHVTGAVTQGDLLALVGPNGAGKSTLLKGIMGELKPFGGSIELFGLTHRDIAYLPQQIDIDRSFPISVFDCVAMGLWRKIGIWRGLDADDKHATARALDTLGILDLANRPIGALSVGQFQRVLFARVLLQDCRTDPARRAVRRHRRADRGRSPGADRALARRRPHRDRGAARSRAGAAHLPRDAAARPRGGRLGADADSADGREPAARATLCEAWEEHADVCERAGETEPAGSAMPA